MVKLKWGLENTISSVTVIALDQVIFSSVRLVGGSSKGNFVICFPIKTRRQKNACFSRICCLKQSGASYSLNTIDVHLTNVGNNLVSCFNFSCIDHMSFFFRSIHSDGGVLQEWVSGISNFEFSLDVEMLHSQVTVDTSCEGEFTINLDVVKDWSFCCLFTFTTILKVIDKMEARWKMPAFTCCWNTGSVWSE